MSAQPEPRPPDKPRRRAFVIGFSSVGIALAAVVAFSFGAPTVITPEVEEVSPADEAPPVPTTSPTVPATSATAPGVEADLALVLESLTTGIDTAAVTRLGQSGDLRVAWNLADLMRFIAADSTGLRPAFTELTGVNLGWNAWLDATNYLIEADVPALPGFAEWKGAMYTLIEPSWAPFFADQESLIDRRHVTWGGVLIDDRALNETHRPCPRGCIPALDDPVLVSASEGDYYPDDAIVFAVEVEGEAVAFPKNLMEVHEMVNLDVGGRRLGIPYCTLCGSAQAYLTDEVPKTLQSLVGGTGAFELRTSGLLIRSNKMMYEYHTRSMLDTFTGRAVSGPLREAGVRLTPVTVMTTRWGEWRAAKPHTLIVAEDGGIGRSYPADPLRGRDDRGPIFPTGDRDPRLDPQEKVLGVLLDGEGSVTTVGFPVATVHRSLDDGSPVRYGGVEVVRDGGGLRAFGSDGVEIPVHEAFWFAWSQFYPGTVVWFPA